MKAFGAGLLDRDLSRSSWVCLMWGNRAAEKELVMKKLISSCAFAVGLVMGLSACTDPYDPGQRAIGGGLFGAGTGAAIGGIGSGYNGTGPMDPATTDPGTTDLTPADRLLRTAILRI
jgi:hypothetical protein